MLTTTAPTSTIAVENPATGHIVGEVPSLTEEDVAQIAARGRAAQPGWAALGFDGRARVLKRAQRWVIDNADRVLETLLSETGKTQEDARIAEIPYTAAAFAFWAKHAPEYLADERVRSRSPFMLGRSLRVRYSPLGLVGVIGPWNYPLMNSFGDCVPALAAGNAVIHKPSTTTPLTAILMGEALRECGLPEDVYQVATGSGGIGSYVVDQCDCIMFTGSTATGRKIMARAAETLTPVHLELGGKDPMIVLADADLDVAAAGAVQSAFLNSGQICISTERVYVEAPVYDAFVSKVVERTSRLRQGVPGPIGSTDIGAMATADQVELVDAHVRDAVDKGARVLTGGRKPDGGGHFYPPTVLVDVDHSMECMVEETFGPTLPIMRVADAEEAVRLANDSPYGLQASVWSRDRARARALARRLEAGVVTINDAQTNYMAFELPMGGWKLSGIGSRHGKDGIRKYAHRQSVMENRFPLKRPPHAMPYSARRTNALHRMTTLLYGRGRGT
jgi:acyl-CoA reductase-like NAD-dependent aldehyde dehydrogenase